MLEKTKCDLGRNEQLSWIKRSVFLETSNYDLGANELLSWRKRALVLEKMYCGLRGNVQWFFGENVMWFLKNTYCGLGVKVL